MEQETKKKVYAVITAIAIILLVFAGIRYRILEMDRITEEKTNEAVEEALNYACLQVAYFNDQPTPHFNKRTLENGLNSYTCESSENNNYYFQVLN